MRPFAHLTAALLGACVLGLAACNDGDGDSEEPQAARFEAGPCPTKRLAPEVKETLKGARCGVLIVPENRDESGGRTIRNGVAIFPSKAEIPAPDPIVYAHGGPGSSAIAEAHELVDNAGLNRDRDLILMSQRGNLHSQPELTCLSIDEFNARSVSLDLTTEEANRERLEAARQCHDEVAAKADLAHYNTTESAADLDDLREALGIHDWNVIGHSYGTQLVLTYMRDYPEHIRAVVLDGIVPNSQASFGLLSRAAGEGFHALARACSKQADCRARYGDLDQKFNELLRQSLSDPVETTVKTEDGKAVKVVLSAPSLIGWLVFASHVPAEAPPAIAEAADGKPQRMAEQIALKVDPEGFEHMSWGLLNSATCAEWEQGEEEEVSEGRKAFPEHSEKLWSQVAQVPFHHKADCTIWDVPEAPSSLREPPRNNIPTLVINGSFDTQTAASNGSVAASTLPNSTNVVIKGAAHGTFFESACSAGLITSFLNHPNVPDTGCVAGTKPEPFPIE